MDATTTTYNLQADFYDDEEQSEAYAAKLVSMNVGAVGRTGCALDGADLVHGKDWFAVFVNRVKTKEDVERVVALMKEFKVKTNSYAIISEDGSEIKRVWMTDDVDSILKEPVN